MSHFSRTLLASLALAATLAGGATGARAADYALSGQLALHNSVVQISFTLNQDGSVDLWTDSWLDGLNFDPAIALYDASGTLVAYNDDDDITTPVDGAGNYNARLQLTLSAGSWTVALMASPNAPAGDIGSATLADGFAADAETPVPIGQWDQPSYDINKNDQKGTLWTLNLSGVDSVSAVPEPSSAALWLAGVLTVGRLAQRSRRQA